MKKRTQATMMSLCGRNPSWRASTEPQVDEHNFDGGGEIHGIDDDVFVFCLFFSLWIQEMLKGNTDNKYHY